MKTIEKAIIILSLSISLVLFAVANIRIMKFEERNFVIGDLPTAFTIIKNKNYGYKGIAVLLHGFSGSKENLKPLAYSLASIGIISVLIDLNGHGNSGGAMIIGIGGAKVSQFVPSVLNVIDFLNKSGYDLSNIIVIGHSMGGALACYLGLKYGFFDTVIGIAPAIGLFEDVQPQNFSLFMPKNVLFVLGGLDVIIDNSIVYDAFKQMINDTPKEDKLYFVGNGVKMIHIVDYADHLGIIFSDETSNTIISWISQVFWGINQKPRFAIIPFLVCLFVSASLSILMFMVFLVWKFGDHAHDESSLKLSLWDLAKVTILSMPLSVFVIALLSLLTRIFVSAFVLGVLLAYALSILLMKRRTIKINIFKLKQQTKVVLGIIIGLLPIVIIEITIGSKISSLFSIFSRRIYAAIPIFVSAVILFWILSRVSSWKSKNIAEEITHKITTLLPAIIPAIIIGALIFPQAIPFIVMIIMIHIFVVGFLLALGFLLPRLPIETRIVACSIVYMFVAIAFSPIITFSKSV